MGEKVTIADAMAAVDELKIQLKNNSDDFIKVKVLNDLLSTVDDQNQAEFLKAKDTDNKLKALQTAYDATCVKVGETEERAKAFELELAKVTAGASGDDDDFRKGKNYQALMAGLQDVETDEQKQYLIEQRKNLLRTDDNAAGGFMVFGEVSDKLITPILEVSPIRALATSLNTNASSLDFVKVSEELKAEFEGEAEEATEGDLKWDLQRMPVFAQTVFIPISNNQLMFSHHNVENVVFDKGLRSMEKGANRNFVVGNGVKRPHGMLTDSLIIANHQTDSVSAGALTYDDVNLLPARMKEGYEGRYLMNKLTLAQIRGLKDANSSLIWIQGFDTKNPSTINGEDFTIVQDMPDIAVGSIPLLYADLNQGYQIVNGEGLSVIRDGVTSARKRIVNFTLVRYLTGGVIQPEAFKTLKIAA